jgi:hypothetical protein
MKKSDVTKKILLFLFVSVIVLNFVSAVEINLNATGNPMQFRLLKYEPYPVSSGEYFDFWVSAQYIGSSGIYGSRFELIPEYPFSLDSNESSVQDFGIIDSPAILVHYKIKVDKNAVEGTNHLKLNYNIGDIIYTQTFNIEVENSQTNFDAVIQDISGSDVSIAIANVGKYAANAVIVKIPNQDSFTADISGQMVGNLAAGDYSVVGFSLSQKMSQMGNQQFSNKSQTNGFQFSSMNTSSSTLKFDIYYTDNIGVRRIANMELPLSLTSSNSSLMTGLMTGGFPGRRSTSSWSVWYTVLIIIVVLGITFFILLKKFPKQIKIIFDKIKTKFKKKKQSQTDNKIPDWIKNSKFSNSLNSPNKKEREKK